MMRLSDSDLDNIEQELALLAGVAPRGWVALSASLAHVGAVQADSTVEGVFHCNAPHSTHHRNVAICRAASTVLNDAGKLLMEVRRLRDAATTEHAVRGEGQ